MAGIQEPELVRLFSQKHHETGSACPDRVLIGSRRVSMRRSRGKSARRSRKLEPWELSSDDDEDGALASGSGDSDESFASVSDTERARAVNQVSTETSGRAMLRGKRVSGAAAAGSSPDDAGTLQDPESRVKRQRAARPKDDRRTGSDADTDNLVNADTAAEKAKEASTQDLSELEDIETEPEFDDGYDAEGYGDEQDRAHLLSLTAVERETILAERFERRQREYEAYLFRKALRERRRAAIDARKQQRDASSADKATLAERERAKKRTRKQALDALAQAKRRDKSSSRRRASDSEALSQASDLDESDWSATHPPGLSESDSVSDMPHGTDEEEDGAQRRRRGTLPVSASASVQRRTAVERSHGLLSKTMTFADLVDPQTGAPSPLVLTRGLVERFHQKPWFTRFALGSFVRVPLPPTASANATSSTPQQLQQYVLARVSAILKAPRLYPVPSTQVVEGGRPAPPFKVGFRIQAELCGRQRRFSVDQLSRHAPSELEWLHYGKRHQEQRLPLPSRDEVEALRAEKLAFMRGEIPATPEEIADFQAEFERLHPEAVNYARRITQVRAQLAHAQEAGDMEKQNALAAELERLAELETRYGQRPREGSSNEQVRDMLLSRRHHMPSTESKFTPQRPAPEAELPLAASLMLLKRTVEEQNAVELDPFARRVARGTSYFFTPSKATSSEAATDASASLESDTRQSIGATGQPPPPPPPPREANIPANAHRAEALRELIPQIERWLWYGPLLEPLRNVELSSADEDVFLASRARFEHLRRAQGDASVAL